jgi:hypothetical protein
MSAPGAADLCARAHRLLEELGSPLAAAFLDAWPEASALHAGAPTGAALPVLRHLPAARDRAPPFSAPLVRALVQAAPALAWHRSYAAAEVGAAFHENYGWTEFAGLKGPVHSERLACGVLLLGPGVTYPAHSHEAVELYVPLSGTALWRQGDLPWTPRPPGSVILHRSFESHAMRSGLEPLIALYCWRSDNLDQESHLDAAATP